MATAMYQITGNAGMSPNSPSCPAWVRGSAASHSATAASKAHHGAARARRALALTGPPLPRVCRTGRGGSLPGQAFRGPSGRFAQARDSPPAAGPMAPAANSATPNRRGCQNLASTMISAADASTTMLAMTASANLAAASLTGSQRRSIQPGTSIAQTAAQAVRAGPPTSSPSKTAVMAASTARAPLNPLSPRPALSADRFVIATPCRRPRRPVLGSTGPAPPFYTCHESFSVVAVKCGGSALMSRR